MERNREEEKKLFSNGSEAASKRIMSTKTLLRTMRRTRLAFSSKIFPWTRNLIKESRWRCPLRAGRLPAPCLSTLEDIEWVVVVMVRWGASLFVPPPCYTQQKVEERQIRISRKRKIALKSISLPYNMFKRAYNYRFSVTPDLEKCFSKLEKKRK